MQPVVIPWTTTPPDAVRRGAVAVGNFDGVHPGHRDLVAAARAWGSPAVAVTFDPPPSALVSSRPPRSPLSTLEERAALLAEAGADAVVVFRADAELVGLTAAEFFDAVIVNRLAARAVVEGYNFRFGRDRGGDTALLRSLCDGAGIAFSEVPARLYEGEPVSSSRVRAALADGNVALAARLLGRLYAVSGTVVTGARRGRTIGFPTANLGGVRTLLPLEGVYAGWATTRTGRHAAAVNLGGNPTFGEAERKLEIHLLDFAGDLYGEPLRLQFVERLRGVTPFASVADLVAQLNRDVAASRLTLGAARDADPA